MYIRCIRFTLPTVKDPMSMMIMIRQYLDFYGGHAVISVGHGHPHYIQRLKDQLDKIGFYSNSVQNNLQDQLADMLGKVSNYEDYQLFLINSGAEANENALKLASFHTGKSKIIAFKKGFHGRTAAAVNITDNPGIIAPYQQGLPLYVIGIRRYCRLYIPN